MGTPLTIHRGLSSAVTLRLHVSPLGYTIGGGQTSQQEVKHLWVVVS